MSSAIDWSFGLGNRMPVNISRVGTNMTANNKFEPTGSHGGPRLAAAKPFLTGGSTGR